MAKIEELEKMVSTKRQNEIHNLVERYKNSNMSSEEFHRLVPKEEWLNYQRRNMSEVMNHYPDVYG